MRRSLHYSNPTITSPFRVRARSLTRVLLDYLRLRSGYISQWSSRGRLGRNLPSGGRNLTGSVMIVIGLGTGRSGTASLAKLLNAQRDALCFHEMNPSCVRFSGTPRPILNTIDEYQAIVDGGDPSMLTVDLGRPVAAKAYDRLCKMHRVRLIGDIAFYYLSYVEAIAARNPNVRFLCLRRDIDETVASWINKSRISRWPSKHLADRIGALITRAPFHKSRNFWMEHDGSHWQHDPVWDKCFPKFEAASMPEAIRKYCEFYYAEAEQLARKLQPVFRFVDTPSMVNGDYQSEILSFLGVPVGEHVFTDAHIHQSRTGHSPKARRVLAGSRESADRH